MTEQSYNKRVLEQLAVLIPLPAVDGTWEFGLAEATAAAWAEKFPEVQVCWGTDGGDGSQPFNHARAMNGARLTANRPLLLNSEYDHLPPKRSVLVSAVRTLLNNNLAWVRPYRDHGLLDEVATRNYLEDSATAIPDPVERIRAIAAHIVRAQVYDDIEFDERFISGLGLHNGAFRRALRVLHPSGRRLGLEGSYILWKPEPQPEDEQDDGGAQARDAELLNRYVKAAIARGRPQRMRALVEGARLHRDTRLKPLSEHERERLKHEESITTSASAGVQVNVTTPDPDPASATETEALSTVTLLSEEPDYEAAVAGTLSTPRHEPAAVEGYRWPEEPKLQSAAPEDQEPEPEDDQQPEGIPD